METIKEIIFHFLLPFSSFLKLYTKNATQQKHTYS